MKKWITAFFILLSLLLPGCAGEAVETEATVPAIEYIYTTQQYAYAESGGQFSFRKELEVMETDRARYYFEANVPQAEREGCVEAAEQVFSKMDIPTVPEIFVLTKGYDGIYLSGHSLYAPLREWESLEFAADLVLAAYGEFTHYGSAWGYASLLCDELGWESFEDSSFAVPQVKETADGNLLCFDEAFASPSDIQAVKQLARGFALSQGKYAMAALLAGDMGLLCDAMEGYYQENGFDYRPTEFAFSYGGVSLDYRVKTELAAYSVEKDWVDATRRYGNETIPENFLHGDYAETREFFDINLEQMRQYQELFGLDTYDNDLLVVIERHATRDGWSWYDAYNHAINLSTVTSLMHEYIHSITMNDLTDKPQTWEVEGFTTHFSHYFNHYLIQFENSTYPNLEESAQNRYLFEYREAIGRPIDMAVDFEQIDNIYAYSRGYTHPITHQYQAGGPFIGYLVKLYGAEDVIQHSWGDHRELPKPINELAKDWAAFLEENYGQYSAYRP